MNRFADCRYVPDCKSTSAPLGAPERAFMYADVKRMCDEQMACVERTGNLNTQDEVFPSSQYLATVTRLGTRDARPFFLSGFKQVEELVSRNADCCFLYATPTMVGEPRKSHASAPKIPLLSQPNEWLVRARLRLAVGMSVCHPYYHLVRYKIEYIQS